MSDDPNNPGGPPQMPPPTGIAGNAAAPQQLTSS